jgi:hypothetical protein
VLWIGLSIRCTKYIITLTYIRFSTADFIIQRDIRPITVTMRSKTQNVLLVQTLGYLVRIPLEAWISVFLLCLLSCVGSSLDPQP